MTARGAVAFVRRHGIVLQAARGPVPSLAEAVAGGPIRGSWWGHPQGQAIFAAAEAASEHADVLVCKLVEGKVTYVHRRLWPALVSVGEARQPWQVDPLTPRAAELLDEVNRTGRVRATGPSSKALARALLVHAEQVHTAGGSHATELVSWPAVRSAREIAERLDPDTARRVLEEAAEGLDAVSGLPWVRNRTD